MTSDDRHHAVEAARTRAGLTVEQLWLRYVALGGSGDAFDVDGHLQGLVPLETFEQDVLAQAVNEAVQEICRSLRVPLSGAAEEEAVDGSLDDVVARLLPAAPGGPDAGRAPSPSPPPAASRRPRPWG